jgi:exodeoxyribonuclease V alpha subunit
VSNDALNRLYDGGIVSELDLHFAGFMGELAGTPTPELLLAAALASSHTREGHICLDLSKLGGRKLLGGEHGHKPVLCPETAAWHKALAKSSVVGKPGAFKPLILAGPSKLYLYRYWDYQQKAADLIGARVRTQEDGQDKTSLKESLERLFGATQEGEIDWQMVAGLAAVMKRFCVISGGPGTGKTTTIAKILALIIDQGGGADFRIALAAPTGKAAARLQEAIRRSKASLNCTDQTKEMIPEEASTIHRLLGSIPGSPYFRHNSLNKLPVDVLVVDEASMVDLALMSKLLQALDSQGRLILLGDKDQLASVEAGAVLGDLCDSGGVDHFTAGFCKDVKQFIGYTIKARSKKKVESPIQDCIVQLQKNFRFGDHSGISAVSRAVNEGDADLAISLLGRGKYEDMQWKDLVSRHVFSGAIRDRVAEGYGHYLTGKDVGEIFDRFDRFRILCALREGPYGVKGVNALVEQVLKAEGVIEPEQKWYPGRPLLITSNDYNLRLFNGDVGMILSDPEADHELRAFFPFPDGGMRKFHPLRLPEHETVYAMTVHKSQGSEFDRVLLILPDRDSPVLTRELVYTGITRARKHVEIWASEPVFRSAVSRPIERMSGLREALVSSASVHP